VSDCGTQNLSVHSRSKTAGENALQEIVLEPNFLELTAEEVKLKIKTIRTRYVAMLVISQQM
jgi:hypothetical protein